MNISVVNMKINKLNSPIEQVCSVKKYLKTKDKINFSDEYIKLCNEHKNDFEGRMIKYITFVLFNLLIVKYYTDIEIEISYDCFDSLMEFGIIDKVVEYIQVDYTLLIKFIEMDNS